MTIPVKESTSETALVGKVTGIGGVFFKAKGDPKLLADWYSKNLGVKVQPWGGAILKGNESKPGDDGDSAWMICGKNSEKFEHSHSDFIVNYRVDDLDKLTERLKKNGVTFVKEPTADEYGKFVSIVDPDGNRIELWEPAGS
jgi:predicted enzyme related to lactoylglutathione lyase